MRQLCFIMTLVAACGGVARADVWTGGGDGTSYEDVNNWDLMTAFPGGTRDVDGVFTVTRDVDTTANRTFLKNGAVLNIPSGTHSDSQSGASIYNFVGNTGVGTVNQSGGSYNIGHALRIGTGGGSGDGTYNLTGGDLIVSRGSNSAIDPSNPGGRPSMEIGDNNGGLGLFEISSGSLATRGGVHIGNAGTFSVLGSEASSIDIGSNGSGDGTWLQTAGGTLKVGIDLVGFTKVFIDEVDGDGDQQVTFEAGSWLDVDYYDDGTGGGTWTVMELENGAITNNGLALAPGVDTNIWSFAIDNSGANGILTVTATGAPPPPPTNVVVSSIADLRAYASSNNVSVTMTPGTYWMTGDASPLFLDLSGSSNTFTLTGVHIKVDTAELPAYGSSTSVNVLHISGDSIVVDGLTLTMEKLANNGVDAYGDPREFTADTGMQLVRVIGSDVTVRNCNFTTGGSYPYGYGDAFGKGARPNVGGVTSAAWIAHKKQSGFLITGGAGNVTVDNVVLTMRSYGHGFFMQQGAHDIVFKDCQVLGDTMTDSDDIIAHPEYQAWGAATYKQPIPADIWISKHEGAFRTYGNSDHASNGFNEWIENVTITNCLVERMRVGVAMGAHDGSLEVYDTELRECEIGFGASTYGTSTFLRCKGDAVNGPLIYFQYSVDQPAIYDVELTGDTPGKGVWPIALISGANNQITLTSSASPGVYSPEAYVNTSQKWREWRHRAAADIDELNTGNFADYTTGNKITNLTDQILVFGPNATGNTDCVSTGGVINKGSGNSYTGTTLAPAPLVFQDTWTFPPNSTNAIWAQTNSSGELLSPTPPYTVFSGTHLIDDALSLGGLQADGGTVVSNGGTLEVEAGFALQGEAVVLAGGGVGGKGALFSDGAIANSTRLNTTSGTITVAEPSSIGVGIAGNQFLVGPIGGAGSLSKTGPGILVMEGGANTFSGALTLVDGEVFARANKAISDLTLLSGTTFAQNANLALNQGAEDSTLLYGTLDVNGRGVGDGNSLSVNIGVLTGGSSGRITSTATGPVQTLNVNSSTSDSSFDGTIDGHVAVVKNGVGTTLTLSGTNTYTGSTTVNDGTLMVNSSLPAASAVAVNNGGTLGGSGVAYGLVTLSSGATVSPGTSVGNLTTGPQTWNGGASLDVEIDNTNGPAGTAWDRLVVNGTVTLDASVTPGTPFQISLSGPAMAFDNNQSHSWLIVDAAGISGGFSPDKFVVDASAFAANNPLDGGLFSVSQVGNDLYLYFTPVALTALESWRLTHFGSITNSGVGADGADPDKDRRKNIVEYATGTDPNVFNAGSAATAGTTLDGTRLTITFNRIDDPVLVYSVEVDNDITSPAWTNIWFSTGASNTVGTVTVQDTELISDHSQRVMELNVSY